MSADYKINETYIYSFSYVFLDSKGLSRTYNVSKAILKVLSGVGGGLFTFRKISLHTAAEKIHIPIIFHNFVSMNKLKRIQTCASSVSCDGVDRSYLVI